MDETEQAHHELERLQAIITRHEGHIFVVRSWLLTVVGALLAAYYTGNIDISETVLRITLPLLVLLFLVVELRHVNLVEAVVERAAKLEQQLMEERRRGSSGWYDGPKVSEACRAGARRIWPSMGMTLILNQAFYIIVVIVIVLVAVSLPPRRAIKETTADAERSMRVLHPISEGGGMPSLNTLLDGLTLIVLAAGGGALLMLKTAMQTAVKTSAEEAAKAAVKALQWPAELARELEKTRGIERQELRFKSYGGLWKELRPLAIYDPSPISKDTVGTLSSRLSDWYFTEGGGLLLTPQARFFYFALQDLLRATSSFPEDWHVERSSESERLHKDAFRDLLTARKSDPLVNHAISVLAYLSSDVLPDWQHAASDHGRKWRAGVNRIAADWGRLDARQRFVVLQQVGSVLRTALTADLESRLR